MFDATVIPNISIKEAMLKITCLLLLLAEVTPQETATTTCTCPATRAKQELKKMFHNSD